MIREGPIENIWIQPADGDSGGALGTGIEYPEGMKACSRWLSEAIPPDWIQVDQGIPKGCQHPVPSNY